MNADANESGNEHVVDSADDVLDTDVADTDNHTDSPDDLDDLGDLDNSDIADISDLADDAGDLSDADLDLTDEAVDDPVDAGETAAEVPFEPLDLTPEVPVPAPPATGDAAIDEAMAELAEAQAGSTAERIDAGERAHRKLQGRLADLGGA
jgi:hypothetical protein